MTNEMSDRTEATYWSRYIIKDSCGVARSTVVFWIYSYLFIYTSSVSFHTRILFFDKSMLACCCVHFFVKIIKTKWYQNKFILRYTVAFFFLWRLRHIFADKYFLLEFICADYISVLLHINSFFFCVKLVRWRNHPQTKVNSAQGNER